jgi:hypothetical protein
MPRKEQTFKDLKHNSFVLRKRDGLIGNIDIKFAIQLKVLKIQGSLSQKNMIMHVSKFFSYVPKNDRTVIWLSIRFQEKFNGLYSIGFSRKGRSFIYSFFISLLDEHKFHLTDSFLYHFFKLNTPVHSIHNWSADCHNDKFAYSSCQPCQEERQIKCQLQFPRNKKHRKRENDRIDGHSRPNIFDISHRKNSNQ